MEEEEEEESELSLGGGSNLSMNQLFNFLRQRMSNNGAHGDQGSV
jgi:hypothetical protein